LVQVASPYQHQVTNVLENCVQTFLFGQILANVVEVLRKLHLFLSSYGFMNIHRRGCSLTNGGNEDG